MGKRLVKINTSGFNINNKLTILLVILSTGLFLRIYDLGNESLWLDEGCSIEFASLNLHDIFLLQGVKNPPLYYIILHWWINLFGNSGFSIRFPSVIFGSLSIFIIYKIGNQLFDKNVGLLSSLLLGLSVFHIRYSQEARTYSLTALLTLLSIYFFVKLFEEKSHKILIGYTLVSILLMYSHIYGLFIIISQNIYFIVLFFLSKELFRLNIKRWILTQSLLIVLFIPWIKFFIAITFGVVRGGFWIPIPSLLSILKSFGAYSSRSVLLLLLFLILVPFSIVRYERAGSNADRRNILKSIKSYYRKIRLLNINENLLLWVWLSTPIIFPFLISLFSTPIYTTRYTIVASPAFYILIARGISNINHKQLKAVVISIIIVLSLVHIQGYYTKIDKEQWKDVANYIDTNAKNDDLLLFNAGYCQQIFDCYSKETELTKKPFPRGNRNIDKEVIKELAPTVEGHKRVWVILAHSGDKKKLIAKKLIETYNLSFHREYVGIEVALFEMKDHY